MRMFVFILVVFLALLSLFFILPAQYHPFGHVMVWVGGFLIGFFWNFIKEKLNNL